MSISSLCDKTALVQRAVEVRDSIGTYTESWSTHIESLKCRIQPVSGSQGFVRGKENANITVVFYCIPADITESDRILYDSRAFRVQAVRDTDEQGRLMVIGCTEESH